MTGLVLAIVLTSPRLHTVHEGKLCISQLRARPLDPRGIAGNSGGLTHMGSASINSILEATLVAK